MSRPRVVYILGSLAANDTGEEIVAILGHLSRAHFEPRVIALGGREDLREQILGLEVRADTLGLSGVLGTWMAVPRVRSLLEAQRPDVVHGYGSWGGAVAQLSAPNGAAVVRTVTRPPTYENDIRGRLLRFLERRARRRVGTHFVVPNEGSRGLAVRAYGAADGQVTVMPPSVDLGDIREAVARTERAHARTLLGVGPDQTAFVLITDFESGARMDEILAGFATAARERSDLRLFVVGSGRYESSTRWKAEELRLGDSLVFLGRGAVEDPVWSGADLAIDATPWSSWSRQALIAIAAGLPTVKRQEGLAGWSEDAGEELPMISGDPDRFAHELLGLAADPESRSRVKEHGASFVRRMDVVEVAEKLGGLYESLAN